MSKRSPDPALFVLAHLLRCAAPDLSGAPAAEIMPTLLQQARHAKEPVRCALPLGLCVCVCGGGGGGGGGYVWWCCVW